MSPIGRIVLCSEATDLFDLCQGGCGFLRGEAKRQNLVAHLLKRLLGVKAFEESLVGEAGQN
jgi:hypothetical protein